MTKLPMTPAEVYYALERARDRGKRENALAKLFFVSTKQIREYAAYGKRLERNRMYMARWRAKKKAEAMKKNE